MTETSLSHEISVDGRGSFLMNGGELSDPVIKTTKAVLRFPSEGR